MFDMCLKRSDATLYAHLDRVGVLHDIHVFVFRWMQTLFMKRLPLELATRLCDCFLLLDNGTLFLIRVTVAIFLLLKEHMLGVDAEDILMILNAPVSDARWQRVVEEVGRTTEDVTVPKQAATLVERLLSFES